ERPKRSPSLQNFPECDQKIQQMVDKLWSGKRLKIDTKTDTDLTMWRVGKGRVVQGPYYAHTFDILGIERDLVVKNSMGEYAQDIAWTHRTGREYDIYFISNQRNNRRTVEISLRANGQIPELYNP